MLPIFSLSLYKIYPMKRRLTKSIIEKNLQTKTQHHKTRRHIIMIKIGLTGGIGSGKSVASDAFAALGVDVIDTDIIARSVLIEQPSLLKQLSDAFGQTIIDSHGQLNRENLASIAFKNNKNKQLLDSIMHPAIRQETLKKIHALEKKSPHYCIIVVPLLVETQFNELVDRVLVITAPQQRKLDWLKKRSQLDAQQATKIIQSQSSDAQKLKIADDHIHNDRDIEHVQAEVEKLHRFYLSLSLLA